MAARETDPTAFDMPGGESSTRAGGRPIDLDHLARQTLGDRELEREVLDLFIHQAVAARDDFSDADRSERLRLAHALKGSARGVGAFAIADCVAEMELRPDDASLIRRLSRLIDQARDFLATINR